MKSSLKYIAILFLALSLVQCKNSNITDITGGGTDSTVTPKPPVNTKPGKHRGVMMQGFYWNTPLGGNWWNTIKSKAAALADMKDGYGINRIWLPAAYKANSGGYSMGYDPYDYYDLGNYHQKGTTETRFGSKKELEAAIAALNEHGIKVMEDIVLNHRSGGGQEWNAYLKKNTYTDFSAVKSGKMAWHWEQFHPNSVSQHDPGHFGGMPDVCYKCRPVASQVETWMKWLKNDVGFNGGWRFDFVKGLYPWVITEMKHATGNPFTIGEYFDGNVTKVNNWINQTSTSITPASSAFDFPLYFTMVSVIEKTDGSGDISKFVDPNYSLAAKRPSKAVTFAANHDTDKIVVDKMLAYAFILTYQGYPCIFWKDYFNYGLATSAGKPGNGVNALVWVRNKLAKGLPKIDLLEADNGDLLIYESKGYSNSSPGYIVAINDNPSGWKTQTIQTSNTYLQGKTLKAYAWFSTVQGQNKQPKNVDCSSSGKVTMLIPPRGYVVYSVKGF